MKYNYNRSEWIKVSYNNKLKRIFNPPKNLPELIDVLKKRFPDIEQEMTQPNAYVALSYMDNDGDLIDVEDSRELLEAYRYGQMITKSNVMKFHLTVQTRERKNEI